MGALFIFFSLAPTISVDEVSSSALHIDVIEVQYTNIYPIIQANAFCTHL